MMKRPSFNAAAMPPFAELPPIPLPPAESAGVMRIDNHVYFYADVNPLTCLNLMNELRAAAANLRAANFTGIPVILHIMSDGGAAFSALAVADQMHQVGWPIHAVVEGLCASAGTLIALACDRCAIQRNAFMLIHSLSAGFDGTYEQVKDHAGMLETLHNQMVDFYVARTSAERGRIEEMMKRDTWLSAAKALEAGIVYEVL